MFLYINLDFLENYTHKYCIILKATHNSSFVEFFNQSRKCVVRVIFFLYSILYGSRKMFCHILNPMCLTQKKGGVCAVWVVVNMTNTLLFVNISWLYGGSNHYVKWNPRYSDNNLEWLKLVLDSYWSNKEEMDAYLIVWLLDTNRELIHTINVDE